MEFVKTLNKKSKVKLYILKDFSGKIIDVKTDNNADYYYVYNGNIISHDDWCNLPHYTRDQYKFRRTLINDYGYEEVEQFVFKAKILAVSSGNSSRYTSVIYFSEIDGVEAAQFNWYGMRSDDEVPSYGMTVGNIQWLMDLSGENQEFSAKVENNKLVFSGLFVFETNKNDICIAPYVE